MPNVLPYASRNRRGFRNIELMFSLWFGLLLGGSFHFWNVGPSILFLVYTLFWVLWFIYDRHGLIIKFRSFKKIKFGIFKII
jgi:hypothetical protein